ncbi:hypothetical protein GCM10009039_26150 [Halocalculus aciditolerans]|uniref:Uncharacterized protein n=1 Tax=Halocalculus aciditolerans TaxID=1383812 RepID=A0A830FLA9_9EURY|nr:hypothetical protein GCM10009039_26150 [Halocalculus aciditolerans]
MGDRTRRLGRAVSTRGAYAAGAVGVLAGYVVAGERGAVAVGAAGYFGVKSMQSLYKGL